MRFNKAAVDKSSSRSITYYGLAIHSALMLTLPQNDEGQLALQLPDSRFDSLKHKSFQEFPRNRVGAQFYLWASS